MPPFLHGMHGPPSDKGTKVIIIGCAIGLVGVVVAFFIHVLF